MKKYKVLKECVVGSKYYKAGDIYKTMDCARGGYMAQLINHGFIEELGEALKTVWDLRVGDTYWARASRHGLISESVRPHRVEWSGSEAQLSMRDMGGIFLTEEDCWKNIEWENAKQVLLRDTKGFKPDWDVNTTKYEVYYDYFEDKLSIGSYCSSVAHRDLWFATEEDAEESIRHHEKEWKTYLGVEE